MKLRVKWRHKVTVQLENQELWLEQHGHCMKPALREPLFIYPLPARRHNVNTKHAKQHQTLVKTGKFKHVPPSHSIHRDRTSLLSDYK